MQTVELGSSPSPAQATNLLSFLCPYCDQRLNVPAALAGVAGPCPSCSEVIRAPQGGQVLQMVAGRRPPTTSEVVVSAPTEKSVDEPVRGPVARARGSAGAGEPCFKRPAQNRARPPAENLDRSWRERYKRERMQSRKRHRRLRFFENLLESDRSKKMQRICLALIAGILVLTVVALYPRSPQRRYGAEEPRQLIRQATSFSAGCASWSRRARI